MFGYSQTSLRKNWLSGTQEFEIYPKQKQKQKKLSLKIVRIFQSTHWAGMTPITISCFVAPVVSICPSVTLSRCFYLKLVEEEVVFWLALPPK